MTERMLKDVFELSDDLRVSEDQALSLYARVSRPEERMALANCIESPWLPPVKSKAGSKAPSLAAQLHHSVPLAARELYFYERSLYLQTLRMLLQHRLQDSDAGRAIVEATDSLLQNGLMENLIRLIRDTSKINNMHQEKAQRKARVCKHSNSGGLAATRKAGNVSGPTILPLLSDKWRRNALFVPTTRN
jgi:hypothetical protein